jgi:hypothetical protein
VRELPYSAIKSVEKDLTRLEGQEADRDCAASHRAASTRGWSPTGVEASRRRRLNHSVAASPRTALRLRRLCNRSLEVYRDFGEETTRWSYVVLRIAEFAFRDKVPAVSEVSADDRDAIWIVIVREARVVLEE